MRKSCWVSGRMPEAIEVAQGMAKGCAAWLNDDRWTSDYSKNPASAAYPKNKGTGAITV